MIPPLSRRRSLLEVKVKLLVALLVCGCTFFMGLAVTGKALHDVHTKLALRQNLRCFELKDVCRVNSNIALQGNLRIVSDAATNLSKSVRTDSSHEGLISRKGTIEIRLPLLLDRVEVSPTVIALMLKYVIENAREAVDAQQRSTEISEHDSIPSDYLPAFFALTSGDSMVVRKTSLPDVFEVHINLEEIDKEEPARNWPTNDILRDIYHSIRNGVYLNPALRSSPIQM